MHLSVGHSDARFGHEFYQHLSTVLNGLDFIVQKVRLAAAFQLAQQGLADRTGFLAPHKGLDGQSSLGGRGNN